MPAILHRTLHPAEPVTRNGAEGAPRVEPRPAPLAGRLRGRVAAGICLVVAGAVVLMGIITAEAVYPGVYTTHNNEVSDLGATRPPNSIIRQPSARIFNGTMLVSGALVIAGAVGLRMSRLPKKAWVPLALLGLGTFGVGVFPGDRAPMHGLFAMLAFVSGGLAAVMLAWVLRAPLRWMSLAFGAVTLGTLVIAMFEDATPLWDELGDGGIERWIVYPVALWLVLTGAHWAGAGREVQAEPAVK